MTWSTRSWWAKAWPICLGGLSMLGCATTRPTGEATQGPPPEAAADYYPFATGWKWAYEVRREGDTILATYAVLERRDDTAIVQAGPEKLSYALMSDGIARREGVRVGDYVLRSPIHAGASWPIEGGQAKVVVVGRPVTVPGGTFGNCATVEENRTDPQRITRTVYCAGVGPVSIDVQVHDPLSGTFKSQMSAVLLGVTRPGEDPLGVPEATGGGTPTR